MSTTIPNSPAGHKTPALSAIHQNGHKPATVADLVGESLIMPDQVGNDADDLPEVRHPLAVEPVKNLKLGWISDYTDLAAELTAAPRQFHELAALTMVAVATNQKAYVKTKFAPFGLYPAIYANLIAISSAYGKGTSTDMMRYTMKEAMLDKLIASPHFTSEGLIEHLSRNPCALVIRNEISALLSSDRKQYTKDLKTDLTDIFDGKPVSRKLSHTEVKVDKPFLHIFGNTTPDLFYANTAHGDWTSGLLPRFLFAMPNENDKPDFRSASGMYTDDHADSIKRLAFRLMEFEAMRETQFLFGDNALDLWVDWQATGMEYAFSLNDTQSMSIIRRYNAYALKFAILLAAVNGSWGKITQATMETAMKLADNYKATVHRILTESDKHKMTGAKATKIFQVIKKHQGDPDGVTLRKISQYANMSKAEVEPYIEKLKLTGEIGVDESGRTPRYVYNVDALKVRDWSRS